MSISFAQGFLIFSFIFLIGCMIGWVIEVFFRRFFTAKRWVNPGFMKGPWLPLYGFGVVLMAIICIVFEEAASGRIAFYNPHDYLNLGFESGATWWDLIPIAIIGASMTLLEFLAGLIFVKGFHVRLWDYCNMKGNIMGLICPVFSAFWLIAGIGYYYGVHPFIVKLADWAYRFMFGVDGKAANIIYIFFLGVVFGVMLIDFITSCGAFAKISAVAKKVNQEVKAETIRAICKVTGKSIEEIMEMQSKAEEEKKKRGQAIEEAQKKLSWFASLFLIDPNAKKASANYDENGRPISTKDEK